MSELQKLKTQIAALGKDAGETAQWLASYRRLFAKHSAVVTSLIGGSSQRVDQDLIAGLTKAQTDLQKAMAALNKARSDAVAYAQSI